MFLPKLFNHGTLRSIKTDNGKLVFEGTYGKEEFEGGSLPEIGEGDAGKVLMVDGGEAKWLWQLPPGTAGKVLTKTGTGAGDIAWRDVPTPQTSQIVSCDMKIDGVFTGGTDYVYGTNLYLDMGGSALVPGSTATVHFTVYSNLISANILDKYVTGVVDSNGDIHFPEVFSLDSQGQNAYAFMLSNIVIGNVTIDENTVCTVKNFHVSRYTITNLIS